MPLTAGTKIGRYRLEAVIGAGGMGVVYRAKDLQLRRDVAIKVLPENLAEDRTALKRLEREARAIAALSHPNILSIHDFDSHEGTSFVVMELLEGQNLKTLLRQRRLSFVEAVEIATSIARGLDAAHSKGVIHRDLKPDNIFLTSDSRVKILDFGLAVLKPVFSTDEISNVTTDSAVLEQGIHGTVPYMSPEQLRDKRVDPRSDIFSFGSVFYEMLTGHPPFLRDSIADSVSAILHEDPPYEEIPAEAIPILRSCLQKNPDQRIQDARQLVRALTNSSSPAVDIVQKRTALNQKRISSIVTFVLLLLAAAALFYMKPWVLRVPEKLSSVAILPLKSMSGDPKDEPFADGMTEEIIARLARISTIRVISRTSAMQYKGVKKNIKEIGRELGVDLLLEGSIRRTGGKIRLLTNLIDARTDRNVWSKTFEEEMPDILSLQNELAREIARELKATLTPSEAAQLSTARTILPEAYDAYLAGLNNERKEDYSLESVLKQIAMFDQAIDLDPNFTSAYVSLSKAHAVMNHFRFQLEVDHAKLAKEAADRALEIDPEMSEARVALGYYYYWCLKDYDRALNQFGLARKDLPNDTRVLEGIGYILRRQGNYEAALSALKKALVLSPRDLRLINEIGNTLSMDRQYAEADKYYIQANTLFPDQFSPYFDRIDNFYLWDGNTERAGRLLQTIPLTVNKIERYWITYYFYSRNFDTLIPFVESKVQGNVDSPYVFEPKALILAKAYRLSGHPDQARRCFETAKPIIEAKLKTDPDSPTTLSALGFVYAGLGDSEQAIEFGKRGFEIVPMERNSIEGTFRGMDLAKIYIMVGQNDAAVDQLDGLLSRSGLVSVKLLQLDPEFEPIQKLPRFQQLTNRYGTH